jgi:hypothetical protein
MDDSELESIRRRGMTDRQTGVDYFANPHFDSTLLLLAGWIETCSAGTAGWLAEDAGRTERIRHLQHVLPW